MICLPSSLLTLVFLTIPLPSTSKAYAYASPQPALVSDAYVHLIPRHTLFFRQVPPSSNLQSFSGALGGFPAAPITDSGDEKRRFRVEDDTFTDFESAANRSCDLQFDACAKAANERDEGVGFEVGECDEQKDECKNTQASARVQDFQEVVVASENFGEDPEFPDFDLICEV